IALELTLLAWLSSIILVRDDTQEFMIGLLIGVLLSMLYWHPFRVLGFVLHSAFGLLLVCFYGILTGAWIGWMLGLTLGLAWFSSIRAISRIGSRSDRLMLLLVGTLALPAFFMILATPPEQMGEVLTILTAALILFSWLF